MNRPDSLKKCSACAAAFGGVCVGCEARTVQDDADTLRKLQEDDDTTQTLRFRGRGARCVRTPGRQS